MNNVEKAVDLFDHHFHCSQSVFAAFAEELGLTEEQALKTGGCFGAGMNKGEVCGCVTGALMALGLKNGQCREDDMESRTKTNNITVEFYEAFKAKHGSCLCRDLLGYDFGNPEDLKKIYELKPYVKICPALVKSAAELTAESLEK